MDEEEPNCNICFEPYDDEEHSPRTLRCGHTLCTPCIDVLVKKALPDRVCPECRKTLKISNASHLPISYTILRLSRALSNTKRGTDVQVQVLDNNSCMKHGAPTISWCPLSDKWHCFKCIHEDKCDSLLSIPEAFLHIKQNYSQTIDSKLSNANNLNDSLKKEQDSIKSELSSSEKKYSESHEKLKTLKEWINVLENNEAELVEAETTIRLSKAIVRIKRDIAGFDSWMERSQPSVKSRITSSASPSSLSSSIVEVMNLRDQLQITQVMYAVHESKGFGKRYSKVTMDNYYLLVHALEFDAPPAGSTLISFDSVLKVMDKEGPLAFFEMECQNKYEGRVYFEMFGNTPRAQQFLKLCTGEDGPCYRESKFMEFAEDHHRYVRGGLPGDNINSEPIVKGITDGGVYRKKLVPGLLNGWRNNGEYWALCDIVLECDPGYEDDYSFGKVMHGLSILQGAAEANGKRTVMEVLDCGIIIEIL